MNWKGDDHRSVARASRAVGGRYEISREENIIQGRPTGRTYFQVRRRVNRGNGQWDDDAHFVADTLELAKAMAEADNQRRMSKAGTQTTK
jgi:hypothetical protein